MRRIGVLTPFAANDAEGQALLTAFAQGLQHSGWIVGQNIRIEYRWGDGRVDTMRKYAAELVVLAAGGWKDFQHGTVRIKARTNSWR